MRASSLCVGIVDYEHPAYGTSVRRLKFATSDASAFCDYLQSSSARTGSPGLHRRLLDREAVLPQLLTAVDEIASSGVLDLFVLYLAGHGEPGDGQGGWFCLADAVPGSPSLETQQFGALLNRVRARHVLVVVDCCHAEALVGGMQYFTSLEGGASRLFVASARRDQFAWEDDTLKRSVLSDVFLRACSTTSPIQTAGGTVRVEAGLFPYLREQVPLLAASQKQGAVQEPVSGGSSCADLELPVVDSRSFGRALTVAQTVRRRLRQVLLKGALALLLAMVGVQTMVYHLTADAKGRIVVRSGLPATYAVMPLALGTETDTGFRVEDLKVSAPTALAAIARGKLWGVASHLDASGLRPWFSEISPHLQQPVLARSGVLINASVTAKVPEDSQPPLEQALFLSILSGTAGRTAADRLFAPAEPSEVPCGSTALDYSLLNAPAYAFAWDMRWEGLLAQAQPQTVDAVILRQIQNSAYRTRSFRDFDRAAIDIRQLALSLRHLQLRAADSRTLLEILEARLQTPCRSHAAFALGIFASDAKSRTAEALLLADLLGYDRVKQATIATVPQYLATEALQLLSAERPLQSSTMEALGQKLITEDPLLDHVTPAHKVLRKAAEFQRLPDRLVDHLFKRLEALEGEQFGQLAALNLLAPNMPLLPADQQTRLVGWLDRKAHGLRTMSEAQVATGFVLAARGRPSQEQIQRLVDQLSPAAFFATPLVGYRGEDVLSSNGEHAGVALGRVLRSHPLPDDIVDRLVRLAIGRPDIADRQVIIDALAVRWYEPALDAAAIHRRLAAAASDDRRRQLEVEVACSRLVDIPRDRETITTELLLRWRQEAEPELRSAIARVVARSQWPRYADMSLCANG